MKTLAQKEVTYMWAYESVFYQISAPGLLRRPLGKRRRDSPPHPQGRGLDSPYPRPGRRRRLFLSGLRRPTGTATTPGTTAGWTAGWGPTRIFPPVCKALHGAGIRVVLDGVFNHVGRGFWAFQDVLRQPGGISLQGLVLTWISAGNNGYQRRPVVRGLGGPLRAGEAQPAQPKRWCGICLDSHPGTGWSEFDIDGLRLDVAYCLDRDFLRRLRSLLRRAQARLLPGGRNASRGLQRAGQRPDAPQRHQLRVLQRPVFQLQQPAICLRSPTPSCASSARSSWTLYKGKHLFNFVDNHDVTRIASLLQRPEHLKLIYALLFSHAGHPLRILRRRMGRRGAEGRGGRRPASPLRFAGGDRADPVDSRPGQSPPGKAPPSATAISAPWC